MHPAELSFEKLLLECDVQHTRRKGPGGQHRNKVETAVVLKHLPSGTIAEANETRSQGENKKMALFRLRNLLALEVRTSRENGTSQKLRDRTKGGRISINPSHLDFPSLLAEVMDFVFEADFQLPVVAEQLGLSSSQILKFLKLYPAAFGKFNQQRQARGLPRLKF